jgi:hypothetical protein
LKRLISIIVLLTVPATILLAQVVNLKGKWKFHVGDKAAYASQKFNDADWEGIEVPSAWEDQGFHGYDGFAWYRTKFDGRKLDQASVYYLNLGYIDDCDEVYLNDSLIGFSGHFPPKFKTAYNSERRYVLPSHVIKYNGENTIALRVFDVTQAGGIVDGRIGIYRNEVNTKMLIDLQGVWSFAPSWGGERVTNEKDWRKIMVPIAWEFQGLSKYDGFAWYKRSFSIPANFTAEEVVLILGKIDDFDKVYFNGTFIGSTNDNRPYGMSESYNETRVYEIPKNLIKRNKINTIEVLVEDMGNVGGIYEGAVGITTKKNFQLYFDD